MGYLMRKPARDLWDPFDLMGDWQHEMNRLFQRFPWKKEWTFEPDIDVVEEKDSFLVKADLPGIKKEDLDIKVEGKFLTLKGERKEEKEVKEKNYFASERRYGAFTRTFELPTEIKAEQIKAAFKDGVLEMTLPKEEGAKAKQITIELK